MNQRIRHRLWLLVCMLSAIIVFPRQVHADMGPKPSVHIQFENMDDELCYGTLLCENESTGPASILMEIKNTHGSKKNILTAIILKKRFGKHL